MNIDLARIPTNRVVSILNQAKLAQEKLEYEGSLSDFFKAAWSSIESSEYIDNWAIDAMAEHLEAVTYGQIRRLLINISPRCGKPVCQDELVLTKRGIIALKEVVIGDLVWTHKGRWKKVLEVHEQGELPVFKITTSSGREVEGAADHPFLTTSGWVNVSDLAPKDVLGLVPIHVKNGEDCGVSSISKEEARLLGYLIGDGRCHGTPNITCGDDIETEDIIKCVRSIGFEATEHRYKLTKKDGKWLRRISIKSVNSKHSTKKGYIGPVRSWLLSHGIDHTSSYTKLVPQSVMIGTSDIVSSFIGAYWACDGWVQKRGLKREDVKVGCASVNKELMRQIQILLLRLGINSILRKKVAKIKTKKQGDVYVSWMLDISTQDDVSRFSNLIHMFHEKYGKLLSVKNKFLDFDRTIIKDVIESIEPSGNKRCRCLTVENDRGFTVGGFAVHNTNLTSICWPAWVWAQRNKTYLSGPQVRFMCGSYNDKLTLTNSNKVRRLILSPFYQKYWGDRFELTEDQNTKSKFDTTKGGGMIATSVRGTLLGVGGDVICVDDPHNTEDVESEIERETAERWWKELSSTRMNNPKLSPIVVNMQRLHTKDISGLILDSDEEFVHLMIPMRYDERRKCVTVVLPRDQVDEFGNEIPEDDQYKWEDPRDIPGELMWPERFDEKEVKRIETRLGPIMASGRLQQTPTPAGGAILKRDWWQEWGKDEAAKYGLMWDENKGGIKEFPDFEIKIASLDTAFSEKEENDYSALTVWGIWSDKNHNPRAMLVYAWQRRLPLHGTEVSKRFGEAMVNFEQRRRSSQGLVEAVAEVCKKYKVNRLLIENKSRGLDVANEIRRLYSRENWGLQLINPIRDKVTRAHSIVPVFADGVVWAPDLSWADEVITQCELFPKDDHDDLVDTVTMAIGWLRDNGIIVRGDEVEAANEEEMAYRPQARTVAEMYNV